MNYTPKCFLILLQLVFYVNNFEKKTSCDILVAMITRIEGNILASNTYVVSNGKSCFIVDCTVPVEKLKETLLGQKVEAVFITHGHYDHIYFLDEYLKTFDCKFYASEFAIEYLSDAYKNASRGSPYPELEIKGFKKVTALSYKGEIKAGVFAIKYFQLGGHSKGDMMFDFGKNIFVGDLVIGRDVGRTDLYGGDKNEMIKSLEFLENYDYKIMFSGHGKENEKDTQNKVIKIWKKYLSR